MGEKNSIHTKKDNIQGSWGKKSSWIFRAIIIRSQGRL